MEVESNFIKGFFFKNIYLLNFLQSYTHFTYTKNNNKMPKQQQQPKQLFQQNQDQFSSEQESSAYSSEDEDAVLLTDKVQQKILQTVARLKNKDPTIYKTEKPIFEDHDFQEVEDKKQLNPTNSRKDKQKDKKFTYKDMQAKGINEDDEDSQESESEQLAPVFEEKKAKNKFKEALNKQKLIIHNQQDQNDLFTVKTKLKKQSKNQSKQASKVSDTFQEFTKSMNPEAKQLITSIWQHKQKLDETDLFLKDYILNKKWLSKHIASDLNDKQKPKHEFEQIDEQDQQRSVQMDVYEAKYNFRYQEPDGDKIVQYPREIKESMRIKSETRKEKRKKVEEKKKQEQKQIREQAQKKKKQIKQNILKKLNEGMEEDFQQKEQEQAQSLEHDWFFCDDCGKAFEQGDIDYKCQQCQDYMLCSQCYELIIHKHPLQQQFIPQGFGAPKQTVSTKILEKLQPCKSCRRKLPDSIKHFEYKDKSQNISLLCQRCYDQSPLDVKKKFTLVEGKVSRNQMIDILEKDIEKVKQLTNSKEIEQMVDEYLKYDYEDVIGGGLKTKFKYVNVKPESYGLSDQQILFGDDKQLNKYVSVKKLAPYRDQMMKLRNNIYKKKIKTIDRSVKQNKQLLSQQNENVERKLKKSRIIDKLKRRSELMKKKRQKKLRILNISNPQREKQVFVPSSRLASYGVTLQNKQQFQQKKQKQ